MRIVVAAAALALGLVAGCTPKAGVQDAARADRVPAAKPIGKPVSCIPLRQIRDTKVYDDRTIDFRMIGNKVYRNVLPYSCPGLGFERAFSYKTSLSQLCSTDIIRVLQNTGGGIRPTSACGLGQFQPVELLKQPKK